jgi:hypothetical protein
MATYRCPECGASHKDLVTHCRLCGAPIENPITVRNQVIDRSVAAERFAPKTLNHFILIGLAIAALIVIGALATGYVHNATLNRWWHKIPGVPEAVEDGWFAWSDPDHQIILDVPAIPEEPDEDEDLDLGADTHAWKATLGDREFFFGYTTGLDFSSTDDTVESDTEDAFTSAAEDMAEQQGGRVAQVGDLFHYQGNWASDIIIDGLGLPDGVAYGSVRMIMSEDGEIYFAETIAYQRNPDAQKRMRSSIIIVDENPETTIPTIPEEVRNAANS